MEALAFLRSKSIIHRDIKPANIVLNEKFQVVLTDFGTAKKVVSCDTSNNSRSAVSDTSYVSGLSAVSQLSDNRS